MIAHPTEGYVFIVTYGRSGSTLIQALLNRIPGYQIRGENNNALAHLVRAWLAISNAKPMVGLRRLGTASPPDHPWYGAERVCPDVLGRHLAETFVCSILQPDPGVRVSGFKEIRFHDHPKLFPHYMRFIRSFFPNSRFVFNTRSHAAVAQSGWWKTVDPAVVFAELKTAERLFSTYAKNHPSHSITLHYDDYATAPDALAPLYDFLGEEMDMDRVKQVFATRLNHARIPGDG